MDVDDAKDRLCAEVDARADVLLEASHRIHEHPELCFEEQYAHDLLCDLLEDEGLDVERGAFQLETAFRAEAGAEGPCIAVCCEYDALPEIGHACGHNIIATAGLGRGPGRGRARRRAGRPGRACSGHPPRREAAARCSWPTGAPSRASTRR